MPAPVGHSRRWQLWLRVEVGRSLARQECSHLEDVSESVARRDVAAWVWIDEKAAHVRLGDLRYPLDGAECRRMAVVCRQETVLVLRVLVAAVGLLAIAIGGFGLFAPGIARSERVSGVVYLAVGGAMVWIAGTTSGERLRELLGRDRIRLVVGGTLMFPALLVLGAARLFGIALPPAGFWLLVLAIIAGAAALFVELP